MRRTPRDMIDCTFDFAILGTNLSDRLQPNAWTLRPLSTHFRDLARNEELSEIAVIHIFFTVLKNKTQLSVGGGGVLRGKFRDKSRN